MVVRAHYHGLEREREREREREKERERERKSNLEKATEEICSSGRPLFVCFFAALQDVGLLEMSCL